MGKIHLLDKHTAELIAAGEVVERPASAAKELIENSIDAGATQITVEITAGGIRCLRVTDNGCGIAREDVETAFMRHATSKIASPNDLDGIETLGFRGEALASIAAVSRIELITRTADELAGTHYLADGGENAVLEDIGCPQGTTILVKDLFYNVPARMKFLKKDISEANAVAGVVERIALSHPEVSFRFIREGKQELITPGDGTVAAAVYAVCGKNFAKQTVPVQYTFGGVQVTGVICKPSAARANRVMQYFFINGRFVKSKTAMAALEQGYKGSLMVGRFPACVLYLTMPAEVVDVNVHPAKIEVRFSNEKPIFDAVYYGVRSALTAGDTPKQIVTETVFTDSPSHTNQSKPIPTQTSDVSVPSANIKQPSVTAPKPTNVQQIHFGNEADPSHIYRTSRTVSIDILPEEETRPQQYTKPITEPEAQPQITQAPQQSAESAQQQEEPFRVIGEIFATYILVEQGEQMYLIDKHAAHEKVIYQQLRAHAHAEAQLLLTPLSVSLNRDEYAVLIEHLFLLNQAGFEVEDFGAGTILVRGVPMNLLQQDVSSTLQEIAGRFLEGKQDVSTEKLDWIYHSVACRAAIKAGDSNHPKEMESLVHQVLHQPHLRYCPHGRPVCVQISRREIEKMFGRIV